MNIKFKYGVVLLLIGYSIDFYGSLQKILHVPNSNLILTIATALKIVGMLIILVKIITNKKLRDLLED